MADGGAFAMSNGVFDYVANAVSTGRCILFLGAGVHAPPPDSQADYRYHASHRPPIGREFSRYLAQKSAFAQSFPGETADDLKRVSLHFEISASRLELVDEVKKAVSAGKQPSAAVRGLAELKFPLVITTNYDHLFEDALRGAGKRPIKSIYRPGDWNLTEDLRDEPAEQTPFVFKIHGDIERPETLVITDEDYIHFVMRMGDQSNSHPVPLTLRSYFQRWPTLFVGYSLMDYNLRLLFKTLRWRMDPAQFPKSYSVDREPDRLIEQIWCNQRQYLRFIAKDIWSFVPELYMRLKGKKMPA